MHRWHDLIAALYHICPSQAGRRVYYQPEDEINGLGCQGLWTHHHDDNAVCLRHQLAVYHAAIDLPGILSVYYQILL